MVALFLFAFSVCRLVLLSSGSSPLGLVHTCIGNHTSALITTAAGPDMARNMSTPTPVTPAPAPATQAPDSPRESESPPPPGLQGDLEMELLGLATALYNLGTTVVNDLTKEKDKPGGVAGKPVGIRV